MIVNLIIPRKKLRFVRRNLDKMMPIHSIITTVSTLGTKYNRQAYTGVVKLTLAIRKPCN